MLFLRNYFLLVYAVFGIISISYYLINANRSVNYKHKQRKLNKTDTYKDVTILVPVYNEALNSFERCIKSVKKQNTNFIVVGDSSYEPYKTITESNGGTFIYKEVREGKRKALSTGINYVKTKYVMFLDSDTTLPKNAVKKVVSKFDVKVGGVGVGVSIRLKKNWVSYSAEFFEKIKEVMLSAMSNSGSVMVLDGRCCTYKTDLIKDFLNSDEYRENLLFGIKSNLAEDRHITSYVARMGYQTLIDYSVYVKTEPQKSFSKFAKQMIRWSRAGYLYFFKELFDKTYFKRGKFYTFEMVYLYVFPIFILLMGIFRLDFYLTTGASNILSQYTFMLYHLASLDFIRFHVGRLIYLLITFGNLFAITIFGLAIYIRVHKRRKRTFILGGLALLMMFFTSIYGLFTLWKQRSWITR